MRILVPVVMVMLATSTALADSSPYDDLMRPDAMAAHPALDMRPRSDHRIDMLAGAAEHRHNHLWQAIDITALTVSNVMLVADAAYTMSVARQGWPDGRREVGMPAQPIIGSTPSARAVGTYFAGAIAINTVLWLALPPRWRSIVPGVVIGAQANALAYNYGLCRFC